MIFFGVIIFCMAIVQPSLVHADMIKGSGTFSKSWNSVSEGERESVTISFPGNWQEMVENNGLSMNIQGSNIDIDLILRRRDSSWVREWSLYYIFTIEDKGEEGTSIGETKEYNAPIMLEDSCRIASVVIRDDGDAINLVGVIKRNDTTSGMILRSDQLLIPSSIRRYNDEKSLYSYDDIIRRKKRDIERTTVNHEDHNDTASAETRSPSVLYPKILLAIDSSYSSDESSFNEDNWLEYATVYFNTIDLHFRYLGNPSIKFHIAAFARISTPYVKYPKMLSSPVYEYCEAINRMSTSFYNMKNESDGLEYDIVLVLTRMPIIGHNIGLSRYGGACSVSNGRMDGLVLHRDTGNYQGIINGVHEVGNLFGLRDERKWPRNCFDVSCLSQEGPTFPYHSLSGFKELAHNGNFSCMLQLQAPRPMPQPPLQFVAAR